jgi:hypothetical protein
MKKALSNLLYLNYFVCYFIKQRWDRDFKSQINYKLMSCKLVFRAYKDFALLQSYLFLITSYLIIGYKKAMLDCSCMVTFLVLECICNSFNMAKVLFCCWCFIFDKSLRLLLDWYCYWKSKKQSVWWYVIVFMIGYLQHFFFPL